ncbi:hypothetical protein GIB67_040813 [Kingdonia uniflora]|uniref:BHLH domain-containing protein n=1 Tax=Kingdonia uniflora TaxID=39325 RepID=A0A7J7P4Q9_9MAGN|nr:hypothetical protein GIB67_040813 [Kingdonia uniflora]
MVDAVQGILERLRPIVAFKSWDYCILWKLNEDQSFVEWVGCCCGGAGIDKPGQHLFSLTHPYCRDFKFQHPRTKCCDLLDHLPSSLPLDSGFLKQTLLSNQPRWINIPNGSHSTALDERSGTHVWIPVAAGLVELFVSNQVSEDRHTIDFVMAKCNIDTNFCEFTSFSESEFALKMSNNDFQQWVPPFASTDNLNSPWDLSLDQTRHYSSPVNLFRGGYGQQLSSSTENRTKKDMIFKGLQEYEAPNQSLMSKNTTTHPSNDMGALIQENRQVNLVLNCSDQIEEDNDGYKVGRGGRKNQSKNLVAERRRRKKLKYRLYALRALVPNITKMDKASILGDAIEFVTELKKQVKDLQDELEEAPEENGNIKNGKDRFDESLNGSKMGTPCSSKGKMIDTTSTAFDDKAQQMEVQVEVCKIGGGGNGNGNKFLLKVFCEHKAGGFVRLMEAMDCLGLEVTNANVTTFRGLVLNIFNVEVTILNAISSMEMKILESTVIPVLLFTLFWQKRDNEMVQAEYVKESLLELTRNPITGCSELLPSILEGQPSIMNCLLLPNEGLLTLTNILLGNDVD